MGISKIALLGDIMPGGLLHYKKSSFIENNLMDFLDTFDYRFGTLECALGDDFEFYEKNLEKNQRNKNIIYAENDDIDRLKELNINFVSIANNHVFDLGVKGFENTIMQLEKRNIKYFGSGMNLNEAAKPAVIEDKGKSLAFIACSEVFSSSPYPATNKNPGYNPLYIDRITSDIKKAKIQFDYVYVLPHWGDEFTYFPPFRCMKNAYKMIDAGADGVFGGHPHVLQPTIYYKNKPVVFSLGNFLFPNRYVKPPAPTFYPDDPSKLEDIEESRSPFCNNITIKQWTRRAREGMICSLNINKKQSINITPTILTDDNILKFHNPNIFDKIVLQTAKIPIKYFYESFCEIRKLKKSILKNYFF